MEIEYNVRIVVTSKNKKKILFKSVIEDAVKKALDENSVSGYSVIELNKANI